MNREISNGAPVLYPLQGDVKSTAGSSLAVVIGLQGRAVSSVSPNAGDVLVFVSGQWTPVGSLAAILVNGVIASNDLAIFVNGVSAIGTTLGIEVNGTPV